MRFSATLPRVSTMFWKVRATPRAAIWSGRSPVRSASPNRTLPAAAR
jgi:hypothetical protein